MPRLSEIYHYFILPGLDGVAQILHLAQQPRSCHGDTHRTDQECNHAQDQGIGKITGEQHQQG